MLWTFSLSFSLPTLTPTTAEAFEQLDSSSRHWAPCQFPPKSEGVWLLHLMRTRWDTSVTVKAPGKGRQSAAGSRSPTLHYLIFIPYQCVKGFVRSYKPTVTGTGTATGQAAIPPGWHFWTALPQGSLKKEQLHPAVRFKEHTRIIFHWKALPMPSLKRLHATLCEMFALKWKWCSNNFSCTVQDSGLQNLYFFVWFDLVGFCFTQSNAILYSSKKKIYLNPCAAMIFRCIICQR